MTATTKTRPDTWKDWLRRGDVSPELIEQTQEITRDELLKQLSDGGVKASIYDLKNWQHAGVIPHGIRRRHEGATRLFYPWWMVDLIQRIRAWQSVVGDLAPLNSFAPRLQLYAKSLAEHQATDDAVPELTVPRDLKRELRRWSDRHFDAYGILIKTVDIRLIDDRGHPLIYRVELPGAGEDD